MKKIITLIMAFLVCAAMAVPAFASTADTTMCIPTIVLHPEQKMIHQLCIFIIVTESAITSEQEPLVDPHKTDR